MWEHLAKYIWVADGVPGWPALSKHSVGNFWTHNNAFQLHSQLFAFSSFSLFCFVFSRRCVWSTLEDACSWLVRVCALDKTQRGCWKHRRLNETLTQLGCLTSNHLDKADISAGVAATQPRLSISTVESLEKHTATSAGAWNVRAQWKLLVNLSGAAE